MLDQTSSPSRHVDRQEAATLLAPLSLEEFRRRYWEREPVVIRGSFAKLEQLGLAGLKRDEFAREVQRAADEARAGFVVGALRSDWDDAARVQPYEYIEAQAVESMVAQGSSIAIDNFGDRQLAELIAALAQQLGHAGEVRVDGVLSPAGEGFPLHIDKGSVIIVQVAGRKRWRFSEAPVQRWPSGTTAFSSSGEVVYRDFVPEAWEAIEQIEIPPLRERVLEPGDVLYIPAGTLHTTLAMDEPSLSVSMLFAPCRTLDLFRRVLADKLGTNPAWRNVPGVGTPGALSDEAREFLAARLAELRELVNGLTPDDLVLNCEWQRRLAQLGTATHARLAPMPVDEDS